jgi:hypothetical protein
LQAKGKTEGAQPEGFVFTCKDRSGKPAAEEWDFPGLGIHSFRRANITWRQEEGGSSIEASKNAGYSSVAMTNEYTLIQLGAPAGDHPPDSGAPPTETCPSV